MFLQTTIFITVLLAATMLGQVTDMGVFLGLLFVTGLTSRVLAGTGREFSLNRMTSNVLMVGAFLLATTPLLSLGSNDPVLEMAAMLSLFQMVLFFRRKTLSNNWLLISISFLHAVVAVAEYQSMWMGFLLFVYLAILALTFFLMRIEYQQQVLLKYENPNLATRRGSPYPKNREEETRIQIEADGVPLCGDTLGKLFFVTGWKRKLAGMVFASFFVGILCFMVFPRPSAASFSVGRHGRGAGAVGFSDSIRLGQLGTLMQDHSELLRIRPWGDDGSLIWRVEKEAKDVPAQLFLRGAILTHYEDGNWSYSNFRAGINPTTAGRYFRYADLLPEPPFSHPHIPGREQVLPPPESLYPHLTRLEYTTVAPQREIFGVWPFYPAENVKEYLKFDESSERILFRKSFEARQYSLMTAAIVQTQQLELTPCFGPVGVDGLNQPPDEERFPTLIQRSQEWRAEFQEKIPDGSAIDLAQYFASQFALSGDFQYSLEGQARRVELDPIEDFMREHPVGHCEYYATALALMLREQGMPSRVVVGFLTDSWNSAGGYYVVRKSDAHAWTEVWIAPEQIPEHVLAQSPWKREHWRYGGWLRLNPTSIFTANMQEKQSFWVRTDQYFRWLDSLWGNYVVEMNHSTQQKALYAPIVRWWNDFQSSAMRSQTVREVLQGLLNFQKNVLRLLTSWVTWSTLFALIIVWKSGRKRGWFRSLGKLYVRLHLPRFHRVRAWFCGKRVRPRSLREHNVRFYHNFEKRLRARGYRRADSQTAWEFLESLREVLADDPEFPEYEQIVQRYYRVRFGHQDSGH